MRRFRQLGAALSISMLVGSGMVVFSTPLEAARPGGGGPVPGYCKVLEAAQSAAEAAGAADLAAFFYEKRVTLGCIDGTAAPVE
jgi:hypothetical protein